MSETDEGAGAQRPETPTPASDGSFWSEHLASATPITPDDTEVIRVPSAHLGEDLPSSAKRRRGATVVTAVACGAIAGAGTWLGLGFLDKAPELTATEKLDEWDQAGNATDDNVDAGDDAVAPWTVAWDATYEPELATYSPDYLNAPVVFDDRLDHANLPPLVPRTSPKYPEAHELTDEIWAAAGPGWMLASYSDPGSCFLSWPGESEADPVFDLVSPEGVHFRLASPIGVVSPDGWEIDSFHIDYANLTEGWAIASGSPQSCGDGGEYASTAVWFDLRSGEVALSVAALDDWADYGEGVLQAVGPLVGGAEVRLYHHHTDDPEEGDGLFVWTPEEGEVPVEIPEGIALGELSILRVADADAGIVLLETPTYWVEDYENPSSSSRFYLLDVTTRGLREVFPAVPGGADSLNLIGMTPTALVEIVYFMTLDGGSDVTAYLLPFDGSTPSEVGLEEGYRLALEAENLIPVLECTEDYCRIVAVNDPGGDTLFAPRAEGSSYYVSSYETFRSTPWGDGLRTVMPSQYGQPMVVEYDQESGSLFEPFPVWIPDTGARSGLSSVFVFSSTPEEG